jgi:hypothetical protein
MSPLNLVLSAFAALPQQLDSGAFLVSAPEETASGGCVSRFTPSPPQKKSIPLYRIMYRLGK